jgi:ribosomal protein L11 methyltransferase
VLLDRGADAAAVLAAAASAAGLAQPRRFKVDRVRDGDWVRRSQSQFGPIAIGGRLRIVPSWRKPPRRPGAVVRMDPGLAFGTGSHPTTRLALAWLEQAIRGGERLLDYGCGSGILAIAARKLGAAGADAVDTDPEARAVADRNARRNKAAVRVFAPEALPPGSYDVLVANILANPLLELAPAFAARVHRAGQLALSGILASQAQPLVEAYAPAFRLEAVRKEKGWVLLAGARQ